MQNTDIAATIKELCVRRGVTISTFLTDCKLAKSFIYDLEKRATSPSSDKLSRIADYFDCSVDYLLGRDEQKEKPTPKEGSGLTDDQRYLIDAIYNMSAANVKKLRIIVDQVIAEREK